MKVLVIHGQGMELRGITQLEIFGPMTLPEYDAQIRREADALGIDVEIVQSNDEGEVIALLGDARSRGIGAVLINPAGFMSGRPALVAALSALDLPAVEVHVSNPARRHKVSEVTAVVHGTVTGFGVASYGLALRAVRDAAGIPARSGL